MAKKNLVSSEKSRKVFTPPNTVVSSNYDNESRVGECGLSKEEKMKRYERYRPSGDFEKDFVDLCSFLGIKISVGHRAKLPTSTPIPRAESGLSKVKDDKKHANTCPKEICKDSEAEEVPVTYTVAENDYKYFKPRVQIETENEANKEYIKEVYIRGWRVDSKIVAVLSKTVPELERLCVLDMWNVGLTDETLLCLGKCLASSSSLKTLSLDGNNSVSGQRFDIFLRQTGKMCLQHLSLRNCNLNETGAFHIGDSLLSNVNLLTLNLCFNKLGNSGAQHLANSLRMNRTLLSLNLGGNDISDEGAKHFSEAISTFSLTHEEVVAKRLKMSDFLNAEFIPQKRNSLQETPSGVQSQSGKTPKERTVLKKRDSQKMKESGNKRDKSASDTLKIQKVQKQKSAVKVEISKSPTQVEDGYDFVNPLLEKTNEFDGRLWIPGNRSLINLNLSRNKLTKVGVELLYAAVKFQVDLARETNRVSGTGIMRICLQNNSFPLADPTYTALNALLKNRDPVHKPPVSDSIEQTT